MKFSFGHIVKAILLIVLFMSIAVYVSGKGNTKSSGKRYSSRVIHPKYKYKWWQRPRTVRISRRAPGWNRRKSVDEHYFSTSITGGYSLFTNASQGVTLLGFMGGAYGIGYEFRQYGHGLWINISPEIQVLSSTIGLNYSINDRWINDSEGRLAMYHYDMIGSTDRQMAISTSLPIMFGYYKKQFYVGAGAKVGYFFYGWGYNHLNYKTHATYDRYIGEYEDMPNHYYTYYESENERKMMFNKMTLGVCFEIGYDIMRVEQKKKTYVNYQYHTLDWTYILKLAFYAEYGFMDINGHEEAGDVCSYDETNPSRLIVQPFYTTQSPTDLSLRPFYAGIKLTFLVTSTCDRCKGKAKVF